MKPTTEIWKPIPAFEGLYEASSSGRIRSLDRITAHGTTRNGRFLKGHRHPDGHLTLSLWRDGNRNRRYVHRLVLSAFAGEPKPGQIARHLNDNPADNRVENLAWGTPKENSQDSVRLGGNARVRRKVCPRGHKLSDPNLVASKSEGHRECLACSRVMLPVSDPCFKKQSDLKYQEIIDGTHEARKNICKRGHPLEPWNVAPSGASTNRRSCLACSRARSRAKSSDVPFTADLADRYFNSIEAARRGEPATDPLPNKKRRDPVTGRYTAGRRIWPEPRIGGAE